MSRAFVKEDGPQPDEDPPERPVSAQPNYVTPRGLEQLREREKRLAGELEGLRGAPLAQTLFGLKTGQTLHWATEAGAERWSVASIRYA